MPPPSPAARSAERLGPEHRRRCLARRVGPRAVELDREQHDVGRAEVFSYPLAGVELGAEIAALAPSILSPSLQLALSRAPRAKAVTVSPLFCQHAAEIAADGARGRRSQSRIS